MDERRWAEDRQSTICCIICAQYLIGRLFRTVCGSLQYSIVIGEGRDKIEQLSTGASTACRSYHVVLSTDGRTADV
jgi:hypothetical protein